MPTASAPAPSPFRILIVDDDASHLALVREILEGEDYVTQEAASGPQAYQAALHGEFDAIVLDKRLPGFDGDEACRRIRQQARLRMLPIIMVTGEAHVEHLRHSMAAGADDFLRKPYEPSELLARVASAVARKRLVDQLDSAESMLFALARMVEAKDGATGDHCTRLSHNAVVFGQALGLGPNELMALRRGGVLHDIGKLGIPDQILLKASALSEQEWGVMRQHTEIGARLVGGLRSMQLTAPIILHHHERWDGSGYPHGLRGHDIPLLARVFQLADIHDALSHARPYKPALSPAEVRGIMHEEGRRGWRDPDLLGAFLELMDKQPDSLRLPGGGHDDLGLHLFHQINAVHEHSRA